MRLDVLTDQVVTQVRFDHEVWFCAESGDRLAIAEGITRISPGGARRYLGGETWRPVAEELLGLLWLAVERAEYIADELLVLSFDDGSSLEVKANPEWEAWRSMRADGSELVCAPDGGLFTWSSDSPGGRARPFRL